MPIDLIFKGKASLVDLSFLRQLLDNAKESRFNDPERVSFEDYEELLKIIKGNDYIDFVITSDNLAIDNLTIKNVFVNLGLNEGEFELLYFFDLRDLNFSDSNNSLVFLKDWAGKFCYRYSFDYLLCRLDNGTENEYYFKKDGFGPLYETLM